MSYQKEKIMNELREVTTNIFDYLLKHGEKDEQIFKNISIYLYKIQIEIKDKTKEQIK